MSELSHFTLKITEVLFLVCQEGTWGAKGTAPLNLNLSTRGGEWSSSQPERKAPSTHWWVGSRVSLLLILQSQWL